MNFGNDEPDSFSSLRIDDDYEPMSLPPKAPEPPKFSLKGIPLMPAVPRIQSENVEEYRSPITMRPYKSKPTYEGTG